MTGKWADHGVPHRGWELIGSDDVGEYGIETCEMCEVQTPRYIYEMQHPQYHELLRVGCDCAKSMSTPYSGDSKQDRGPVKPARKNRQLAKMVLQHIKGVMGQNFDELDAVLYAIEHSQKVELCTAIGLARRLRAAEKRAGSTRRISLESLEGVIDFRGSAPKQYVERARREDLLLIEEMLALRQKKIVKQVLEERERREAEERRLEEERSAWAASIRAICEKVWRIQTRKTRSERRKQFVTTVCKDVCLAAEQNQILSKLQLDRFLKECEWAKVEFDKSMLSGIAILDPSAYIANMRHGRMRS